MAKELFTFADIHMSTEMAVYGPLKNIEKRMQLHCL